MNIKILLAIAAMLSCVLTSGAEAEKALDATLYTGYAPLDGETVNFVVCGSVGAGEGCYGGGSMSPFEKACAVLEGIPKTKGNVMTRDIYVLDKRKSTTDLAQLFVYTRKDTFSSDSVKIATKYKAQVILHIPGGDAGECQLAGNKAFVYAGVAGDKIVDSIDTKTLMTASINQGDGAILSITSNDRGFVAVNFPSGAFVVDPNGATISSGGIQMFLTSAHQGAHF